MRIANLTFIRSILITALLVPAVISALPAAEPAGVSVRQVTENFPPEYLVSYSLDGNSRLLDIGLTNFDFSKVSLVLSLESSNAGEFTLRVRSFEISNFVIPSLPMRFVGDSVTNSAATPEVAIAQKPLPLTVSNMAPMEEIYPIGDLTLLWIVLIALLVLGGGGFLAWMFLFRKKGPAGFPGSRVDPYEEALKALNRFRQMRGEGKHFKEIYLGVWEAVRRFLERVFTFRAMEMSTTEIVSHFNRAAGRGSSDPALEEIHDIAIHLLKACDRVKYAKFQTTAEQTDIVLADSFELVRRTREHFDRLKAAEEETKAREMNV